VNGSQLALGIRQSGLPVNDVVLPPWAAGPEELLGVHRCACLAAVITYVPFDLLACPLSLYPTRHPGQQALRSCWLCTSGLHWPHDQAGVRQQAKVQGCPENATAACCWLRYVEVYLPSTLAVA
jgi:hypothetical protein